MQKNIEELIKNAQITEALNAFGEFLEYCADARKEWIQLQSWHSGVYNAKTLGTVGKEADIEINKIVRSLVEKITDFEREILPKYFERKDFAYHINDLNNSDAFNIKALNALLAGRSYRIVNPDSKEGRSEKIAEGNSTISYMAYDENIKEYAIVQVFKNESSAEMSSKWIDALINLKHRNIIRTYDHSMNSYPRFIIKEYIHGISFEQAITKTGKRPVSQVAWWLYQLTDVLLYLQHKRVTHYNVRPSKIFIDDEWKIVLSPFDPSLLDESDGKISLNRFLSICKYISPEKLKSLSADSFFQYAKVDISSAKTAEKWKDAANIQFSLGAIMYYAITGVELFPGDSVYAVLKERDDFAINPDYRKEKLSLMEKNADSSGDEGNNKFLKIIEQLLSADPRDRFSSLHELLHHIHPLLQNHVYQGNDLQDSYRRALTNNSELIRDFYNALMEKSDTARIMFTSENQDNTIKIRRQQAILQMTIDILIKDDDNERAKEISSKILNSPLHAGLNVKAYEVFLDTLIFSILASDPEYPNNPDLLQSWNIVKNHFLSQIEHANTPI
jgi:hypothetical protein